VLNLETVGLLEQLGSDSDFMEKLVGAFIKDTQQIFRRLDQESAHMPAVEFRSLVHALKGSVANVGADRLTQYCTRLSSMSDAEIQAELSAVTRTLHDEFDAVRKSLSEHLAKSKRTTA
jgi:HPt (histidine-containing phosphotransfer) domain-containing protein